VPPAPADRPTAFAAAVVHHLPPTRGCPLDRSRPAGRARSHGTPVRSTSGSEQAGEVRARGTRTWDDGVNSPSSARPPRHL
ncbi:hypothetical protein, partial [Streptomyces sp. WG7]|uniref:hypothetical protein n=1 Tax=Streptomyces sp. WG7 TaxID=3417650 RepID=UPI003CEA0063